MKLTPEVIDVLDAAAITGNSLALVGQLDRALYFQVNKALETLGGKWNKKAKSHLFEESPSDAISDAIAAGSVEDRRKALQFFETPPDLALMLVKSAGIKKHHFVLEPSAGHGAIAKQVSLFPFSYLTMVEIDPEKSKKLKAFAGSVHCEDFLTFGSDRQFDRIIANPPFSRQQDIDHVLHMHRLLAPGGVLVSVMSNSVTFRKNRKTLEFVHFVRECGGTIEPLPDGSFRESGTSVSTCVVRMGKAA